MNYGMSMYCEIYIKFHQSGAYKPFHRAALVVRQNTYFLNMK
jgi:hypothetical protein